MPIKKLNPLDSLDELKVTKKLNEVIDYLNEYPRIGIDFAYLAEPQDDWPKIGEEYFIAQPDINKYYVDYVWRGDTHDKLFKERGLIFRTKEEAIAKAKQMLGESK